MQPPLPTPYVPRCKPGRPHSIDISNLAFPLSRIYGHEERKAKLASVKAELEVMVLNEQADDLREVGRFSFQVYTIQCLT
jgi:hypothetical protein